MNVTLAFEVTEKNGMLAFFTIIRIQLIYIVIYIYSYIYKLHKYVCVCLHIT